MTLRAGVDLGGTKIQIAIVDPDNEVVGQCRVPTPQDRGPTGVIDAIIGAVRTAMSESDLASDALVGVGMGSPGQIDADAGTVSHAGNLPDWMGTVEVAAPLQQALAVPVHIGNDVQVGVMAESRLGAGRPFDSMIGIFCGTGVGGGIVLNRELWRGRGAAGEIGHTVVEPGGRRCSCGRRGCMEAYAGRAALEEHARKLIKDGKHSDLLSIMEHKGRTRMSSGVWAKALDKDDPVATDLIGKAEWAVGIAAANAVNLLDVEAIVIGGGLGCRLGAPFAERIAHHMHKHLLQPDRAPQVLTAALGDLGGAIGAALLVEHA